MEHLITSSFLRMRVKDGAILKSILTWVGQSGLYLVLDCDPEEILKERGVCNLLFDSPSYSCDPWTMYVEDIEFEDESDRSQIDDVPVIELGEDITSLIRHIKNFEPKIEFGEQILDLPSDCDIKYNDRTRNLEITTDRKMTVLIGKNQIKAMLKVIDSHDAEFDKKQGVHSEV